MFLVFFIVIYTTLISILTFTYQIILSSIIIPNHEYHILQHTVSNHLQLELDDFFYTEQYHTLLPYTVVFGKEFNEYINTSVCSNVVKNKEYTYCLLQDVNFNPVQQYQLQRYNHAILCRTNRITEPHFWYLFIPTEPVDIHMIQVAACPHCHDVDIFINQQPGCMLNVRKIHLKYLIPLDSTQKNIRLLYEKSAE